jgi:hypothetical protein
MRNQQRRKQQQAALGASAAQCRLASPEKFARIAPLAFCGLMAGKDPGVSTCGTQAEVASAPSVHAKMARVIASMISPPCGLCSDSLRSEPGCALNAGSTLDSLVGALEALGYACRCRSLDDRLMRSIGAGGGAAAAASQSVVVDCMRCAIALGARRIGGGGRGGDGADQTPVIKTDRVRRKDRTGATCAAPGDSDGDENGRGDAGDGDGARQDMPREARTECKCRTDRGCRPARPEIEFLEEVAHCRGSCFAASVAALLEASCGIPAAICEGAGVSARGVAKSLARICKAVSVSFWSVDPRAGDGEERSGVDRGAASATAAAAVAALSDLRQLRVAREKFAAGFRAGISSSKLSEQWCRSLVDSMCDVLAAEPKL